MPTNESGVDPLVIQRIKRAYRPFQTLLIGGFMYQTVAHALALMSAPAPVIILGCFGALLFARCLDLIYGRRGSPDHLITNGVFRYTRHPMYTGILLMGLHVWWPTSSNLSLGYGVSLTSFLIGLVGAGYLQEKEVLARFGDKGIEYYRRTPRIFLLYPWYWWKYRKTA